jgi:hypothetical protein
VAVVRTDFSEERIASIIIAKRISELGTALAVTSDFTANVPSSLILIALMIEVIHSSETSILTRATQRHIPEGDTLNGLSNRAIVTGRGGL